jgi:hypothetical protein
MPKEVRNSPPDEIVWMPSIFKRTLFVVIGQSPTRFQAKKRSAITVA